jgi:hypothetical protein
VHVPPTQVWFEHAAPTTHAPVALHVSGSFCGVQAVAPEAHTPVQTPATQVEFVHALPLFCQVPPEPQFCGCCPLHCSWPGAHDPAHAPATQVEFVHVTGLPHVPAEVQVSTPLPEAEHCVAPGAQTP